MQKRFPTVAVFKESATIPLHHLGSVLVSFGIMVGASILAIILGVAAMLATGFDVSTADALLQNMQNGQLDGIGSLSLALLAVIVVFVFASAHIFNYWVNLSAYGAGSARWSLADGRGKAMVINGLKLLFIGILIVIVSLVITFVLSAVGIAPSIAEQAVGDVLGQYRDGLAANIIITVSYCFIYSLFSANLTYTALQSTAEGMEHPYVTDFGIVLIMLYGLFVIPSALAAFIGSEILFWIIQSILGLFITFAIPAAHGVRYRFCNMQVDHSVPDAPGEGE